MTPPSSPFVLVQPLHFSPAVSPPQPGCRLGWAWVRMGLLCLGTLASLPWMLLRRQNPRAVEQEGGGQSWAPWVWCEVWQCPLGCGSLCGALEEETRVPSPPILKHPSSVGDLL